MVNYSTLLVGFGGQGILTAAQILARAGMMQGYKVLMAEIHGMAQRGGRVPCSVRFGDSISSPTIPEGGANLVIALEFAEVLTSIPYGSAETVFVISKEMSLPPIIGLGLGRYPSTDEVMRAVGQTSKKIVLIDSSVIARKAGSSLAASSAMLGAGVLAGKVPVDDKSMKEAMKTILPKGYIDVNIKAYELGRLEVLKGK
jgi:indolepyruvate ferredoxin oxidoreductase beta subunit